MAVAKVQSIQGQANAAGTTALLFAETFTNPTVSGRGLIVALDAYKGGANPSMTISDTYGNTWVAIHSTNFKTTNGGYRYVWVCLNCVGGAGHQVTVSAGGGAGTYHYTLELIELSGAVTSQTWTTGTNKNTATGSSASMSGGAVTQPAVGDFVYMSATEETGLSAATPFTGYTLLTNQSTGEPQHSQFIIAAGSGTQTPTLALGSSAIWAGITLTIPAAAGGTTVSKTFSVTQAQSVSMLRQPAKLLSVTQGQSTSLLKQAAKVLAATQAQSVVLLKQTAKVLSKTQAQAVALIRQVARIFSTSSATSVSMSKTSWRTLSVSQATSPNWSALKAKLLALTLSQSHSVSLARTVGKLATLVQSTTPTLARSVSRSWSLTQASVTTTTLRVGRTFRATVSAGVAFTGRALTQGLPRAILATFTAVGISARFASRGITATLSRVREVKGKFDLR